MSSRLGQGRSADDLDDPTSSLKIVGVVVTKSISFTPSDGGDSNEQMEVTDAYRLKVDKNGDCLNEKAEKIDYDLKDIGIIKINIKVTAKDGTAKSKECISRRRTRNL
jgi:hypothetical protein